MKAPSHFSLALFLLLALTAYADCPTCYYDQQPLEPLHGYSADGRRRVLVGISVGPTGESWADPPGGTVPNQALATAAGKAMSMWNNAADEDGNKIQYYFDTISGIQPSSSVDILIVRRPRLDANGHENEVAEMETAGGRPYKVYVREDMVQRMSPADLAGMFAHEFGHRIGIGEPDSACATIMKGGTLQPDGTYRLNHQPPRVEAADVKHSNYNFDYTFREFCTKPDPKTNYLDTDDSTSGACVDSDGDGWTTCGGDCNDDDPTLTYYCDGGVPACDAYQESECYNSGGTWDSANCACDYDGGGCDPSGQQEAACYSGGGVWDAATCQCTVTGGGCDPGGWGRQDCESRGGDWDASDCSCRDSGVCVLGEPVHVGNVTYSLITCGGSGDLTDCTDHYRIYRACPYEPAANCTGCSQWEEYAYSECVIENGSCDW